jgi:hypothetical protein
VGGYVKTVGCEYCWYIGCPNGITFCGITNGGGCGVLRDEVSFEDSSIFLSFGDGFWEQQLATGGSGISGPELTLEEV